MLSVADVTGIRPQQFFFQADPRLPMPNTAVGVEIELEGFNRASVDRAIVELAPHWLVKRDGSLRDGGLEFVFSEPLFGKDIFHAMDKFKSFIESTRYTVSERCSVHVHLDVRDMSIRDLMNLITYYLIFEKALVQYHGGRREENIFCLPYYLAPNQIHKLGRILKMDLTQKDPNSIHQVNENFAWMQKYSAFNLASMFRFGSVEFRHMGGTGDVDEILEWITVIQHLKRAAIESEIDPLNLPHHLSLNGMENFAQEVFQDQFLRINYPELVPHMYDGIRLVQDILFSQDMMEVNNKFTKQGKRSKLFRKLVLKYRGQDVEEEQAPQENGPAEDHEDLIEQFIRDIREAQVREARRAIGQAVNHNRQD